MKKLQKEVKKKGLTKDCFSPTLSATLQDIERLQTAVLMLADSIEDGNWHGIRKDIRETIYPWTSSMKRNNSNKNA